MSQSFSHFDEQGASRMVDVGEKPITHRLAIASAVVQMQAETLETTMQGAFSKGNVLEVARLAGIQASKRTSELIPLCHLLPLESVSIAFSPLNAHSLNVIAEVKCSGKTGVEMEALTAVSVACLTVYDMCKSVDRSMTITSLQLEEKSGGKSGHFLRENSPNAQN
jgi:cyclic pyranopterin monophosphate synthase